jgi:hypothetical protein
MDRTRPAGTSASAQIVKQRVDVFHQERATLAAHAVHSSIAMDEEPERFQCRWAGCFEMFDTESDWIKHVSIHVFTLKPYERTPWLGPPELDPDRHLALAVEGVSPAGFCRSPLSRSLVLAADEQPDGQGGDDDRAFLKRNILSLPAGTHPRAELPKFPHLFKKINRPFTSATSTVNPLPLRFPGAPERSLSHQASASVDGVKVDLTPAVRPPSPTPVTNPTATVEPASQHALSTQVQVSHAHETSD